MRACEQLASVRELHSARGLRPVGPSGELQWSACIVSGWICAQHPVSRLSPHYCAVHFKAVLYMRAVQACLDIVYNAGAGNTVAGAIWSVALTPDGRRVLTASEDFTARVWDVVSGNCAHVLDGHTGWVVHICVTADGLRCATASHDTTARSAVP